MPVGLSAVRKCKPTSLRFTYYVLSPLCITLLGHKSPFHPSPNTFCPSDLSSRCSTVLHIIWLLRDKTLRSTNGPWHGSFVQNTEAAGGSTRVSLAASAFYFNGLFYREGSGESRACQTGRETATGVVDRRNYDWMTRMGYVVLGELMRLNATAKSPSRPIVLRPL